MSELNDLLINWPLGTLIALSLLFVMFMAVFMAFWAAHKAADAWFLPVEQVEGYVVRRSSSPAYTHYVHSGTIPYSHYRPKTWSLHVQVGDCVECLPVKKEFFDVHPTGSIVKVWAAKGRLTDTVYLKSVVCA